jgi:MoaD family protein
MPVRIKIPTALRQFAADTSELDSTATTVSEALAQLTDAHHELRTQLYRNGNELRNFINVYLNDEDIRHLQGLDSAVKDGDVVTIVPSIAGGQ